MKFSLDMALITFWHVTTLRIGWGALMVTCCPGILLTVMMRIHKGVQAENCSDSQREGIGGGSDKGGGEMLDAQRWEQNGRRPPSNGGGVSLP